MHISKAVELQLLSSDHTEELFRLVDANREHLREWLPWVDVNRAPTDTESFIKSAISQHESGKGPQYAVFYDMIMCGVCGFHPIDATNRIGGIGYWLSRANTGKGVMTLSVKVLVEAGFQEYGLNRIEIACATGNTRSRAIPERLGFEFEGVLREREHLYGRYVDHAIYLVLASELSLNKALHQMPGKRLDNIFVLMCQRQRLRFVALFRRDRGQSKVGSLGAKHLVCTAAGAVKVSRRKVPNLDYSILSTYGKVKANPGSQIDGFAQAFRANKAINRTQNTARLWQR